jgi:hypothetical protein
MQPTLLRPAAAWQGARQSAAARGRDEDDFEVLTLDDYLVPDPNLTFLPGSSATHANAALVNGDLVVVQKNCGRPRSAHRPGQREHYGSDSAGQKSP